MDIKENQLPSYANFFIKIPLVVVLLIMRLNKIDNQLKNYTNQLLETLKKEQFIQDLKTIFGVLTQLICKSLSKYNKGIKYLSCVIDLFSKYAWVVAIKNKKVISIVDAFQEISKESNRNEAKSKGRKPNKIWVGKGSEFYNKFFKK